MGPDLPGSSSALSPRNPSTHCLSRLGDAEPGCSSPSDGPHAGCYPRAIGIRECCALPTHCHCVAPRRQRPRDKNWLVQPASKYAVNIHDLYIPGAELGRIRRQEQHVNRHIRDSVNRAQPRAIVVGPWCVQRGSRERRNGGAQLVHERSRQVTAVGLRLQQCDGACQQAQHRRTRQNVAGA